MHNDIIKENLSKCHAKINMKIAHFLKNNNATLYLRDANYTKSCALWKLYVLLKFTKDSAFIYPRYEMWKLSHDCLPQVSEVTAVLSLTIVKTRTSRCLSKLTYYRLNVMSNYCFSSSFILILYMYLQMMNRMKVVKWIKVDEQLQAHVHVHLTCDGAL